MVVTPLGTSHKGLLHSSTVLLVSNIFRPLISFRYFTVLGALSFSTIIIQKFLSSCH
ncbi:hypothetical protein HanRHA438_Chr15g0723321 [Helianthus annuus]|nr:hypothetical protein HanRHA438_Chr15g0723321 [Helianthus annuus]